jgi:hypothetical protein
VDAQRVDASLHRFVVERIHHLLIVEPPWELGGRQRIADRVGLPGVGLVDLDRPVDLLHPAGLLWGDDAVRQQAARAREVVDEFAGLDDLLVGQKPPAWVIERRATQERQIGVAVVVDLFHIVLELVAGERGDALLLHLRVPVLARKIRQTQQLLVIEVVAHEMGLDVEDKLAGEALRARQHQLGLAGLGGRDLEDITVDVVHCEERRRHAAARVQELPAAQAEAIAVHVGELVDPRLDPLLRGALRGREILSVGDDLGGNRGSSRCRLGARDEALFSFTKPTAHRSPPLLE